jgi:hypothetical protein
VLFGFPALLPIPKRKKFTTNGPQPILRNQELAPNHNRFNGGGLPSKTNIILRWEFPNPSQKDRRSCATSKNLNTKSSNHTKSHNINTNNNSSSRRHTPKHKPFLMQKNLWKKTRKPPKKSSFKSQGKKKKKKKKRQH